MSMLMYSQALRDNGPRLLELTALTRLFGRRCLTVIAKWTIPFYHCAFDTFRLRVSYKLPPFRRIAHDTIKDRAKGLCALQAHIVVSLIDDKLHCRQLGEWDTG